MIRKFVVFFSMVFAVVALSSCWLIESDGEGVSKETKLLICVSDKISSEPRTVFPSVDLEKFTRLELNGSKNGEEKVLLGSWNGVSEIDYVLISEGTWDFELLAYIDSAVYKAEENNLDIKIGTNTVKFSLSLQDIGTGLGCIKYTLYYPAASESGRTTVESVLYTITDYETREIVKSESNLTRNTGYDEEHGDFCYVECDASISAGKYIIKFNLYSDSVATKLINSYEEAVNVISGNVESIGSHWIDKLNDNEQSDDSDITVSVSDLASLNLENIPTHTKIIVNGVFSANGRELAYLVKALENANEKVSVDLSDTTGLVALGEERFSGTRNLISLVLPDTVETISENSFYNSSIKYIYIPSSVTSIENGAFYISDLEEVEFQTPCNVESIGSYGFGSTNIKKFEILPKLTSIGSYAFFGMDEVTFPEEYELREIPSYAFADLGMETFEIPSKITSIGSHAFSGCSNLREITFPEEYALTEIGSYMLSGLSSLETFEIPSKITSIGSHVFSGCSNLREITFEEPCSLTEIGSYAFADMTSVEVLEIPTGVTSIGSRAFANCEGLKSITFEEPCSLTEIGSYAFADMTSVEVLEIPAPVTTISYKAFDDNEVLREVTFPYTIKTIDSTAFYKCDFFDTANYYGTEAMWNSVSGSEYILANVNFLGIDSIPNLDMNFEILVEEDIAISGVEKNDSVYTFTADECFDSYSWKIDSKYAEETSNVFIIDAATLPAGYHHITVYAKKGILIYSASKYIKSEAVEGEDSDQNTETDPENPEPIEPETGDIDIFIY